MCPVPIGELNAGTYRLEVIPCGVGQQGNDQPTTDLEVELQ